MKAPNRFIAWLLGKLAPPAAPRAIDRCHEAPRCPGADGFGCQGCAKSKRTA